MVRKLNCWEFHNCGRERDGLMVGTLGECPVSTALSFDGTNGGVAAGRACWMVRSTTNRLSRTEICAGSSCQACEFYRRVMHEEESDAKHAMASTVA